jgi:predicted chitinase
LAQTKKKKKKKKKKKIAPNNTSKIIKYISYTRHGNKPNRKSDSLLYHLSNKYVLQIKGNQQTQTICRKNQKPKSKKYKQIVKHINYTNKYVKQPQIQNPNGGNNSQIESPKSKIFYQMESK